MELLVFLELSAPETDCSFYWHSVNVQGFFFNSNGLTPGDLCFFSIKGNHLLITLCLVCSTIMVKFYEKLWLLKKITNYWHLNFNSNIWRTTCNGLSTLLYEKKTRSPVGWIKNVSETSRFTCFLFYINLQNKKNNSIFEMANFHTLR
jgi:hypothetical protein